VTRSDERWAKDFIATQEWRFAKTMPQWPHWYIIRGEGNRCRDFDRLAQLVHRHGENDKWGSKTRCYFRVGSYKYWVLDEVMNRAEPIPSAEVRRRGEAWLRAHGKRVGPYGNLIPIRKRRRKEPPVDKQAQGDLDGRAYGDLRAIIERHGGSMVYERAGYRHGAWIISLRGKQAKIEASGNRSFPPLDTLYQTSHPNPEHWDDYDGPLVEDAEAKLLALLR
jgi:hypothetical protein